MSTKSPARRIVIAGTSGDTGKTLVSMGLIASWRRRGISVSAFKKGPDYIDAAWLGFAAGSQARNLDTYMMGADAVLKSFRRYSRDADIGVVEGNRGLFDGFDARGTHSTAELAKLLEAPVILILNVAKVTRTAAAILRGCTNMDPDVNIAGVILNRVAGSRHENVVRKSLAIVCGIPVLGAIPHFGGERLLPGRHLGLVTPQDHPRTQGLNEETADIIDKYVDGERILDLAGNVSDLSGKFPVNNRTARVVPNSVRIAYFHDAAFSFYYPDNLEALQEAGAELVPVSSLKADSLPECEGLYIGGGFPETHVEELSRNRALLESVQRSALQGLPIFAECGGLIYLCHSLDYRGKIHRLAGVFPFDLQMMNHPQGHGYMDVEVDTPNPYFPLGTVIRGHEFHYSGIVEAENRVKSIYNVKRGYGCFRRRDGLVFRNVLASYLHLHAAGTPQWADNFVRLAQKYKKQGNKDG